MQHLILGPTKIVQIMTSVDFDLFYDKVKFGHLGFCVEKSQTVDCKHTWDFGSLVSL